MAARITPSKGGKPDKLMRDALMVALNREAVDADGQKTKKLNIIAAKLVELAVGGISRPSKRFQTGWMGSQHKQLWATLTSPWHSCR